MTIMTLSTRRLLEADAAAFRTLRLGGLKAHPEAFGASWAEEASHSLGFFADRLRRNAVFGAAQAGSPDLVGVSGLHVPEGSNVRHKGVLWGMYVRADARGMGVGAALVTRVIDHAATMVEQVLLTVVTSNAAAMCLYARAGFETYGVESHALKIDGVYHDEALMALRLPLPA